MRRFNLKSFGVLLLAGTLSIPVWAQVGPGPAPYPNANTNMSPAQPGVVNYVEGQVSVGSQPLNPSAIGQVTLQAGQELSTQTGKAEVLLTPGVIFRLDDNSAVTMESPGIANTILTLQRGRAMVEADEVLPENNIVIREGNASIRLTKKGLYEFNAATDQVMVFNGKAEVQVNGRNIGVDSGHELAANVPGKPKVHSFDRKEAEQGEFYRWASLRSSYLAEANVNAARMYQQGSPYWYGTGWYWDPWFDAYTWIPGDGIFWDPFGWGFYSPFMVGYAPYFGVGYGFGYYHHFGPGYHPPAFARGFSGREVHGNFAHGGFGRGGFGGGGFARGGGFAGGGFAGGMHGGFGGGFGGGGRR